MYNWQSRLDEHRGIFIVRSLERLENMAVLLNNLTVRPSDSGLIQQLFKHFHQLNGSAGIYEMHDICTLAASGEDVVLEVIKSGLGTAKSDIAKLQKIVLALKKLFSGQSIAQSDIQAVTKAETPKKQGFDVLLVSADQGEFFALNRALHANGLMVRGCHSQSAALDAMKEKLPEALMISLPLPDGPGYDLATTLRHLPGGQLVPIVILSQQAGFLDKVNAIRCGADAMFDQVLDLDIAVRKLVQLLDRQKQQYHRVLSVEDDPDQQLFIASTLEAAGYNVACVSDPQYFEESMLSFDPDLVLLDVMLGEINGFELARYIRQSERFSNVPIIFFTSHNQLAAHIESAKAGGDEHLVKPCSPQLLVAAIASRLERYRALRTMMERDGLTQCLNFGVFMHNLSKIFPALPHRHDTSLLVFDIDHLQEINEKYGFAAGDRVIRSFAHILSETFRQAETLARIGSDEFAVVIEDFEDDQLVKLCGQIVKDFASQKHVSEGQDFFVTASAAVVQLAEGMDLNSWLTKAKQALTLAKEQGGSCAVSSKWI